MVKPSRLTLMLTVALACGLMAGCGEGKCCDPTTKPGSGDKPVCIEGVTCCGDGQWRCNDGSGRSTCLTFGSECSEVCGGIIGIPCDDPGTYCKLNEGECCCDFQGICVPRPDVCIELFDPVCGCDGETYSNSCFAAVSGVNVDHTGPCDGG